MDFTNSKNSVKWSMVNTKYNNFRSVETYWSDPEWLSERMLFISGPRQVGKTTKVQSFFDLDQTSYFNWDSKKVRLEFLKDPDFFSETNSPWICFDEIHKRKKWKDLLKGTFDTYKNNFHFIVTGSARLETFKKSGDSLTGRYFHTHLFPINIPDLVKNNFILPKSAHDLITMAASMSEFKNLDILLMCGGFPEPFFKGTESFYKRWSNQHNELIVTEDIRDLSTISEIDKIESLVEFISPSVGNLVSYRNLGLDIETSHTNVKRWMDMLHRVHLIFPISPYSKNIRRSYKSDKKWYFVDWASAKTNQFENYIAASLLRACELYRDRFGEKFSLHYVRTHDGAEVDFLLCLDNKPWLLIEAKEGSPDVSHAIHRFTAELKVPCIIVTKKSNINKKISPQIHCMSWTKLAQVLP
jgi:predicted AAA+ superfamily ATPase